MGREIKRVPLDFEWPIGKIWEGYLNPFYKDSCDCPFCGGDGYSENLRNLQDRWYGNADFKPEDRGSISFKPDNPYIVELAKRNCNSIGESINWENEAHRLCNLFNSRWYHHLNDNDVSILIESKRLMDFTHTWSRETGWVEKNPPYIPSAQEVNEWSICGIGHDSINQWIVTEAECKRLGFETRCEYCKGERRIWPNAETKQKYETWEPTEPPPGEGYQMWETISEGSPMSPVFRTPEELARWLADTKASSFGHQTATYEEWLSMIKGSGWAPSAACIDERGFISGVSAMAMNDTHRADDATDHANVVLNNTHRVSDSTDIDERGFISGVSAIIKNKDEE